MFSKSPFYYPSSTMTLSSNNSVSDVTIPEKPRLKFMQKVPDPPHKKEFRNLIDIRGPELHLNTLIHKQYGIQVGLGKQVL